MPRPSFLRRIPRVRQRDLTDCGAAALHSVGLRYGLRVPIARIRQFASTDRRGTNALGLVEAAERIGFVAKAVRGPLESMDRIPKPAIAHVTVGEGMHFVVVYGSDARGITVMDPADGEVHRLTREEFARSWTGVLVLLVPGERFQGGGEAAGVGARLWSLLRPHRSVLVQALIGAVAYTVLGLSTAVFVQIVVDHVVVDGNTNLLNLLGVGMLVVLALQLFLGVSKGLLVLRTGQRIDAALIFGYYQHLLKLPQRFFDTMRVGEVMSRVGDAVKIRAFVNDVAVDLAVSVLVLLLSFGLILTYSRELALLVALVLVVFSAIYLVTNRINRRRLRALMEDAAELEAQLVESLGAAATIKRFGVESHANWRTETRFARLLESIFQAERLSIFSSSAAELTSRAGVVFLLWAGARLVIDRQLTPGELMGCYALFGHLAGPAAGLTTASRTVQDALIAADRLFEIMDLAREEEGGGVPLSRDRIGDIRFERVVFRYGSRGEIFSGLDLTIPRGTFLGIAGESGSGKSTLAALLQGLYPIQEGSIRIDGVDVRHIDRAALRRIVGVVPQDIHLFTGSIAENIALGEPEPDLERIMELSRELGMMELIDSLPEGFHTRLGERGSTLSGGQRQRIAIARALYREPQVLILDEATSSLDSLAERSVQAAVEAYRARGRTVVVIAHRLSTLCHADRIAVLSGGRVAELGTHAELIRREGHYQRMWRQQMFPEAGAATDAAPQARVAVAARVVAPPPGGALPGV